LRLVNVQLEKAPTQSAKGAGYFLTPSPGYVSRATPSAGAYCRGLYANAGVQDGALFGVFGSTLYRISSAYVATTIGLIAGTDAVIMDGLRNELVIVGGGNLYVWDGATLTQASDVDLSTGLTTLAVLGQRAITSSGGTDQLEWSAVLDATDWPSDGFATSEIQPDPVIANVVVGDELYSLGSVSIQIWRAVGGSDADAFDTFAGALINKGCIARDTARRVDASLFWLANDRCLYRAAGADAQRIVNRDLEQALSAMTEAQVSACKSWVYTDGSKTFYVIVPPIGGRAFSYDVAEDAWSERETYEADAYRHGFYAFAYDMHFVSGTSSDAVFTMERTAYDDNGDPLVKTVMLHVPAPNNAVISSIGLDIKTFDQPLTGQGSDPLAMVTFYRDGGSVSSAAQGLMRYLNLGANGAHGQRPTAWRFGQVKSDGFLLEVSISEPVGFAIYGVWINEGRA
jgi:hypothetical protein